MNNSQLNEFTVYHAGHATVIFHDQKPILTVTEPKPLTNDTIGIFSNQVKTRIICDVFFYDPNVVDTRTFGKLVYRPLEAYNQRFAFIVKGSDNVYFGHTAKVVIAKAYSRKDL